MQFLPVEGKLLCGIIKIGVFVVPINSVLRWDVDPHCICSYMLLFGIISQQLFCNEGSFKQFIPAHCQCGILGSGFSVNSLQVIETLVGSDIFHISRFVVVTLKRDYLPASTP